jgi:hypothetical protein
MNILDRISLKHDGPAGTGGKVDMKRSKRRFRLSEEERHCIGHAQYQVDRASGDNPEVCFDYGLIATLLELIDRMKRKLT